MTIFKEASLEDWISKVCPRLQNDIKNHISIFDLKDEDQKELLRLILISVRDNWPLNVFGEISFASEQEVLSFVQEKRLLKVSDSPRKGEPIGVVSE